MRAAAVRAMLCVLLRIIPHHLVYRWLPSDFLCGRPASYCPCFWRCPKNRCMAVFAVIEEGNAFLLFALGCVYRAIPCFQDSSEDTVSDPVHQSSCLVSVRLTWAVGLLVRVGSGWWLELESLSGCDTQQQTSGGLRRVSLGAAESTKNGKPVDKEAGLPVSSRWGLLISSDSLLEPEFQGSCGLGSTQVGV